MFLFDSHWKFWTLNLIFSKTQILFKKLEYRFLVESTKIENSTFSYKTVMSEANVKADRIGSTKWHKKRGFASNYFIFSKILFQFKNSYKELIWLEPATKGVLWKKPQACNFIKKEILAQVFSCEFCEISKNTFFKEHLWTTASVWCSNYPNSYFWKALEFYLRVLSLWVSLSEDTSNYQKTYKTFVKKTLLCLWILVSS